MTRAIHYQPEGRSNVACGNSVYSKIGARMIVTRDAGATSCLRCLLALREGRPGARALPLRIGRVVPR